MKRKIYLNRQEIKFGDKIIINGNKTTFTEKLLNDNINMFSKEYDLENDEIIFRYKKWDLLPTSKRRDKYRTIKNKKKFLKDKGFFRNRKEVEYYTDYFLNI